MRRPRYDFAYFKAYELLHRYNIQTFPFDPFPIAAQNNWRIETYKKKARELKVSVPAVIRAFGSNDAMTVFNGKNYTIAYNSDITSKARILFTLMHEFGHIVCNHFTDFDVSNIRDVLCNGIDADLYRLLETEANCFAANVLAPDVLIEKAHLNSADKLQNFCGLSKEAADIRIESFKKRVRPRLTRYDDGIQSNLNPYINKIRDVGRASDHGVFH
jgi:Zn-dependent peptidase ImmA (M78 family)